MSPHDSRTRISRHAVDRYRQRVEAVDRREAAQRLAELAADSTRRSTPRRWTEVAPAPGIVFLYPHADSRICLIVKDNTVITVFSRAACRSWKADKDEHGRRRARRQPYRRPSPGVCPWE